MRELISAISTLWIANFKLATAAWKLVFWEASDLGSSCSSSMLTLKSNRNKTILQKIKNDPCTLRNIDLGGSIHRTTIVYHFFSHCVLKFGPWIEIRHHKLSLWGQITVYKICIDKSWPYFHCGYFVRIVFARFYTVSTSHILHWKTLGRECQSFFYAKILCQWQGKYPMTKFFFVPYYITLFRGIGSIIPSTKCHLAVGEFGFLSSWKSVKNRHIFLHHVIPEACPKSHWSSIKYLKRTSVMYWLVTISTLNRTSRSTFHMI